MTLDVTLFDEPRWRCRWCCTLCCCCSSSSVLVGVLLLPFNGSLELVGIYQVRKNCIPATYGTVEKWVPSRVRNFGFDSVLNYRSTWHLYGGRRLEDISLRQSLYFCCDVQIGGPGFGINNMNTWTHGFMNNMNSLCPQLRLMVWEVLLGTYLAPIWPLNTERALFKCHSLQDNGCWPYTHPFTATINPSSNGYFRQDNMTCHKPHVIIKVVPQTWQTWQWLPCTPMASSPDLSPFGVKSFRTCGLAPIFFRKETRKIRSQVSPEIGNHTLRNERGETGVRCNRMREGRRCVCEWQRKNEFEKWWDGEWEWIWRSPKICFSPLFAISFPEFWNGNEPADICIICLSLSLLFYLSRPSSPQIAVLFPRLSLFLSLVSSPSPPCPAPFIAFILPTSPSRFPSLRFLSARR